MRFVVSLVAACLLCQFVCQGQNKRIVSIGILVDHQTSETSSLLDQLKREIKAVVGEDAIVQFDEANVLVNEFDTIRARSNYLQLEQNQSVDIILGFGIVNNVIVNQLPEIRKRTILFGALPVDVRSNASLYQKEPLENLINLSVSLSYGRDLEDFKNLYDYKKIGIAVDQELIRAFEVEPLFAEKVEALGAEYKLIPFTSSREIIGGSTDIDAIYIAGGFLLTSEEVRMLAQDFLNRGIASFTSTGIADVRLGLMATNQPISSTDLILRRIALSVEAIINGSDMTDLQELIEADAKLTVNLNTANKLNVPLKYSLIAKTNIVGDLTALDADRTYNLQEAMLEAIDKNLALQSSGKDVELAGQDVRIARSNYLPQVDAAVTSTYNDPTLANASNGQNPEYNTNGVISLNQTVYSQAATTQINIRKDLLKAQTASLDANKLDAVFDVTNAYFNILLLKASLGISASNLRVTERNLEIARQNYQAGQSGKDDVLRFESQQAQNTQQLVESYNQLQQGLYALNFLLNYPISRKVDVAETILGAGIFEGYQYGQVRKILDDPSLFQAFIEFLVSEAKRNAPEKKTLTYSLEATSRQVKLFTEGRFVPSLGLQGRYLQNFDRSGAGAEPPAPFPALPENYYSFDLNMSIPLFKRNQQNIDRQTALIQQEQLLINQSNLDLSIEQNVSNTVLQLVNQIANIELSAVSSRAAEEALDLTQTAYTEGAVNRVQLIDAQNNFFQAQLANATAVYSYLAAFLQLERSIGSFFLLNTEEENQAFIDRFNNYVQNR